MENPVVIVSDKTYISYAALKEYGIPQKTIEDWKQRNVGERIVLENKSYINYNTIPAYSKKKLPPYHVLKTIHKSQRQDATVNKILEEIETAYHYGFQQHREYYANKYSLSADKITHFARLHAVWEKLIEIQESNGWNKAAQQAFDKLFPGRLETYNSFCNALHKAKKRGIEYVSVDGRLFKEKGFSYCSRVDYWIRYYLSNGKNYNKSLVYKLAMKKCEEEGVKRLPKLRCATRYMETLERGNIDIYRSRYGASKANKQMPHSTFAPVNYPLSQVQIDGVDLPFYYKENSKLLKLNVVAVLDSHSRKILGFAFGRSENSTVIFNALESAFRKTEMLPGEIVSDFHSFHKTKEATNLKQQLESMGVVWNPDQNPQRKNKIERFFGVFNNSFLKFIPGHTGEGVLTRNKHGRPSQEYIDNHLKADNLHTQETIKVNVIRAFKEYNNTPLKKYGKSPNDLYEQTEKKHATPLSVYDRVKLFTKETKLKVGRGQININRGGVLHEYQLNAELMHKWNNREVIVRYDDLNEGIYIYTSDEDLPIGEVKPKPQIQSAIVEQEESDREKLLKNKGRIKGFVTKSRKENEALAHKDAVHDANPRNTSKEVLQELQQDADLQREIRDHGVNPDYYTEPEWNEESFVASSFRPKSKLENKSPFAIRNHTPGILNLNDLDDE